MKKFLMVGIVMAFLAFGFGASFLVSRNRGSTTAIPSNTPPPTGVGEIILSPTNATYKIGDIFPVVIKFNTGGAAISALALRITYPYNGAVPSLDVSDQYGNPSNQIYPDNELLVGGDWTFNVNSVTRGQNAVTIDFAAINQSLNGYVNSLDTNLATIYFKVNDAPASNPVILSFDTTQSLMFTKKNSIDILKTPSGASYSVNF